MKIFLSSALCCMFFIGCTNSSTKNEAVMPLDSLMTIVAFDSLTLEQQQMRTQLTDLIAEKTKTVDNRLVFDITKEDFVAAGLPEAYYETIVAQMEQTNNYLDSTKVDVNVEAALESSIQN